MDATRRTLLSRVKDRDDSRAWKEFTGLYRALLLRYARACGLSAGEAKSVTADCMATLADHIVSTSYDPCGGGFKLWLAALAQDRIQNMLCRRGQSAGGAATHDKWQGAQSTLDEEFERIWSDEHLRHCLEQLRIEIEFKTFEAFRHIVVDGWSIDRVCERYDLTQPYVYAMKSRLTQRLRRLMYGLLGG